MIHMRIKSKSFIFWISFLNNLINKGARECLQRWGIFYAPLVMFIEVVFIKMSGITKAELGVAYPSASQPFAFRWNTRQLSQKKFSSISTRIFHILIRLRETFTQKSIYFVFLSQNLGLFGTNELSCTWQCVDSINTCK